MESLEPADPVMRSFPVVTSTTVIEEDDDPSGLGPNCLILGPNCQNRPGLVQDQGDQTGLEMILA